MNLLADENGHRLSTARRRIPSAFVGTVLRALSKADRDYIGADQEEVYELNCEYYRADKLVTELTQDQNLEISDTEGQGD